MMPVFADAASSANFYLVRNANIQTIPGVSNAVGQNAVALDIEKYYYESTWNYHIFRFKIGLEGIIDDVLAVSFDQNIPANYHCQHAIYSMAILVDDPGFWYATTSGSFVDSDQDNNENVQVGTNQPSSTWSNYVTVFTSMVSLLGAAARAPVAVFTIPIAAISLIAGLTDPLWGYGVFLDSYAECRYSYWGQMLNIYGGGPSVVPAIGVERSQVSAIIEWKVPKISGTYYITVFGQLAYGSWLWLQPSPPNPQYFWNVYLSGYVECSVTIICVVP